MRALLALLTVTTTLAALAADARADEASGNSPAANAQMVRGVLDTVFNRHDLAPLDRAMAAGYVQHNPALPQGRAGFEGYMAATFKAVPDWRFELSKIASDGDLVWTYGTYSGTQKGM